MPTEPARLSGAKAAAITETTTPIVTSRASTGDGKQMNFSAALDLLKMGEIVAREGWNGRGMHIGLRKPVVNGQLPYLYILTVQGNIVPWVASHSDLLADDWVLA